VAVSKLLSLSVEQTSHAIGIASTQVIGLREMFGSDTKSFHPGRAAQSGVLAAVLAQQGYTSSGQALEAKRGWANVVGATKEDVQVNLNKWLGLDTEESQEQSDVGLAGGLPSGRWEILRNSFKPYPCGIVIHPVIDGCCQLHSEIKRLGLSPTNIQHVQVTVHPLVVELTGKTAPKDGLEGKFSFYHGGAIGLLYGKATPDEYEDRIVQDPTVVAIRGQIQGTIDPKLRPDEAKIVLTTNDGSVLERHVKHAVGSLNAPMDDEALEKKFKNQCAKVLVNVDLASKACWNIEEVKDISEISKALST
jgi:2-methylcitrate dehydratase PrpD